MIRSLFLRSGWRGRLAVVALLAAVAVAVVIGLRPSDETAGFPPPPTLQLCRQHHDVCLSPSMVRAAYGVDVLLRRGITGRGRTIAIVVSFGSPTIASDLHVFDQAFGLPDPQLTILAPLGVKHPRNTGWIGETTLDVEWAHAIAPGARLVLLESPVDETEGVQGLPEFLALEQYAVRHHLADVISQSWSATEDTLFDRAGRAIVSKLRAFYAQASAQGITFVAASGDDGAAGPDLSISHVFPYPVVGYPASDPSVLAVGGTQLTVDARGAVRDEVAWRGSGGGVSKLFAEPAYQRNVPPSAQRLLRGRRGLPDVAYNAAPASGILIYHSGSWRITAGTSAGTPQWAGLVALADSLAGHDLGNINPALYRLAGSSRYHVDMHDITAGGIVGPHGETAFRAGPGWDAATGLGSPHAASLLPDLANSR